MKTVKKGLQVLCNGISMAMQLHNGLPNPKSRHYENASRNPYPPSQANP